MARTIGDKDEVCHAWANQIPNPFRTASRNLSYLGADLVSYTTRIGLIVPHPEGGLLGTESFPRLVLLSANNYSVTTARHLWCARHAVGVSERTAGIVYVDKVSMSRGDIETNLAGIKREITTLQRKASKARQNRAAHLREVADLVESANLYLRYARLHGVAPADSADFSLHADYLGEIEAARVADAARREKIAAENLARETERREAWIAGMMVSAPTHGGPYLRVQRGLIDSLGDMLETSYGVRVPLAEAIAIFRLAAECVRQGRAFIPGLSRPRAGDFALDRIDADGTIHAGCHHIAWSESSRLAAQLGVLESVA